MTFSGGAWLDAEKWHGCACETKLVDLRGRECYLGIDLSSGGDLTSIALIFPPTIGEEKIYVWSLSFMPELRVLEHEKTDDAPYRLWATTEQLILTSGMYGIKTDYAAIISKLKR